MSVRARPAILSSAAALAAALVFCAGVLAHGGQTSFVAELVALAARTRHLAGN